MPDDVLNKLPIVIVNSEKLDELLEELASDCYEVGHSHGVNVPCARCGHPRHIYRQMVDVGWGTILDRVKAKLANIGVPGK